MNSGDFSSQSFFAGGTVEHSTISTSLSTAYWHGQLLAEVTMKIAWVWGQAWDTFAHIPLVPAGQPQCAIQRHWRYSCVAWALGCALCMVHVFRGPRCEAWRTRLSEGPPRSCIVRAWKDSGIIVAWTSQVASSLGTCVGSAMAAVGHHLYFFSVILHQPEVMFAVEFPCDATALRLLRSFRSISIRLDIWLTIHPVWRIP